MPHAPISNACGASQHTSDDNPIKARLPCRGIQIQKITRGASLINPASDIGMFELRMLSLASIGEVRMKHLAGRDFMAIDEPTPLMIHRYDTHPLLDGNFFPI